MPGSLPVEIKYGNIKEYAALSEGQVYCLMRKLLFFLPILQADGILAAQQQCTDTTIIQLMTQNELSVCKAKGGLLP